ncbi:MAG: TonB-dependent receptor [Acidobacteria bacterium]|nr:TonB-dependent receptor [Acidobacteriota bacterium]
MNKKSSITLVVFILLIFSTVQASEDLQLTGHIVTAQNEPIAGAVILHRPSQIKTVSGKDGSFSLQVPNRPRISLEIIHPDFIEKVVTLTSADMTDKMRIVLKPIFRPREEVTVTAFRYPEASTSIPVAQSVVASENLEESMPINIADGLQEVPGVSNMGAGGFSLVPNIRGLARGRIVILLDSARLTSERRTGPSASFVNARDIETIEVLRSASSVFYGSDAIGGVIHLRTKKPVMDGRIRGTVHAEYGSVNDKKGLGLQLEGSRRNTGFLMSFQFDDAAAYLSPEETVLQSQYTQGSLLGKIVHETQKRNIVLSFLGARGRDIGKANASSADKPTWYPRENENFVQLHWIEKDLSGKGEIDFQAFFNSQFLETHKDTLMDYRTKEEFSRTEGDDYGFFLSYNNNWNDLNFSAGLDYFGRKGVHAYGRTRELIESGAVSEQTEEWPYRDGRRGDLGFFMSVDYTGLKNVDLIGGVRYDTLKLEALSGGKKNESSQYDAVTGFMGGSIKLTSNLIVFANVSSAYRAPSLSELFYTGITGRGMIISQPGLKPERSLNADGGIRFFDERIFIGAYAFIYEIDNLIERYLVLPDVYTYGNVDRGRISGFELEMEYSFRPGWRLFGNYFHYKGKSAVTGEPLNDLPSDRLFGGTQAWFGRFSLGAFMTAQWKKTTPGPAETVIPGFVHLQLRAAYIFNPSLRFFLNISNLLNQLYYARTDPDSVYEPGRSIRLGFTYRF